MSVEFSRREIDQVNRLLQAVGSRSRLRRSMSRTDADRVAWTLVAAAQGPYDARTKEAARQWGAHLHGAVWQ